MDRKITFLLLVFLVLLGGCVQVDVSQKIKRSGNMDMSLTLKAESPMILSAVNQDLQIDPSVQDKFTYEETDTSVTYKFTDIDPSKDTLFEENEDSTADTSIIDKESYRFEKEFKFPYYYYTYEIDMTKEETEDSNDVQEHEEILSDDADMDAMFGEYGDAEMDAMFGEMLSMGYTVEVFGSIVETNGKKMDDNKVKFNIGMDTDTVYYVKFKDFFLLNWLGSIF